MPVFDRTRFCIIDMFCGSAGHDQTWTLGSRSMSTLRAGALVWYTAGVCLACHSQGAPAGQARLGWSVDTLAVIGVLQGDSTQEFAQLVAAEIGPTGDVILLDLRRPGIFWFDGEGRFKAVAGLGRGPGEVTQPRAITVDSLGTVVALDPGNGHFAYLRESGGQVSLASAVPIRYVITGGHCHLGTRLYAGFLHDGMVAHAVSPDGHPVQSFGPAPMVVGVEELGQFAIHARRQIVEPRLFCDSSRDQIVLAGRSHPLVRAYDSAGRLSWSTQLEGIHSVEFEITGPGTVEGVFDPVYGANFARSMTLWDEQHVLIQYVRRLPTELTEGREFHAVDSRLLDLVTGDEVARSERLPLLAAARGDRFVAIQNLPYPKAILGRRR